MPITTKNEFSNFLEKLNVWLTETYTQRAIQHAQVIFISYGHAEKRCKVWQTNAPDLRTLVKRTFKQLEKIYEQDKRLLDWVKVDLAVNVEKKPFVVVQDELKHQLHNNHYRKGISFDANFEICFLEQELYGKAIIKGLVYNEPNFWDETNLNKAVKAKYSTISHQIKLDKLKDVWLFDTIAVFYENQALIELYSTGPENGVRKIKSAEYQTHLTQLVERNAAFLHAEIQPSGRFHYGYFPAYDREIKSYNTVRHCTAIYALLETLEIKFQSQYLEKIKISIQYAIDTFYQSIDGKGFMTDGEDGTEIKLGSNAAAIFMLAKYQEITQDHQFIEIAKQLAKGIQYMVSAEGETTHVLHYPSLDVKEKFRIVYYDGEAALGLLRLYQLNQDQALLDTVKTMFEHFIAKKYDKYHDHWLSYCTNELTQYCPEEKYFQFGMNNYLKHMTFIEERKTAYATFLEMMMSAYKMVSRMRDLGLEDLFEQAKFEELQGLIQQRVEFQRSTGFFYPEVAMYMANPKRILNAFYVRHDRFRTRIDDQEHNLSGYVAFLQYFKECVNEPV